MIFYISKNQDFPIILHIIVWNEPSLFLWNKEEYIFYFELIVPSLKVVNISFSFENIVL